MVIALAGAAWGSGAAADPPPGFLRAPFAGAHLPSSLFDHAAGDGDDDGDGQLAFDGRRVWGRPGHRAYDFAMPVGTPVLAAADGVVVFAGDAGPVRCWGTTRVDRSLVVRVRHDGAPDGHTYVTAHFHLSEVLVGVGDRVTAGQPVARSGNTGCSRGPHLHFQVEREADGGRGVPVDPYGWIGAGPDPWAANVGAGGSPSLWIDGQAPPLRRTGRRPEGDGDLRIVEVVGTDLLDPHGEVVRLAVPATAPSRVSLRGYRLENAAGDGVPLPPVSIAPGDGLAVWVEHPDPGRPGEVGLGRAALVDDLGDCVHLVDPAGRVVGWAPFGTIEARRACRTSEAAVDVADAGATE